MKKNKKNSGIIAVLIVIIIIIFIIVAFIFKLILNKNHGTATESTASNLIQNEYVMEAEPAFQKYGNFKSYDSVVNIITSSMSDASKEEIREEMFQYWFTLVRYGDYEDAYSFIAVDTIREYEYDYDYEDFLRDCENMMFRSTDEKNKELTAQMLPKTTPYQIANNNGISSINMVMITSDNEEYAVYVPVCILDNYKIIPFDCVSQSAEEQYGLLDPGVNEVIDADVPDRILDNENTSVTENASSTDDTTATEAATDSEAEASTSDSSDEAQ